MAIQPHHLNYFPSHITPANRNMIDIEFKSDIYNTQMDFFLPSSAIATDTNSPNLPCFNSVWVPQAFESAESGVTCGTRKRSLDSFSSNLCVPRKLPRNTSVSFLGEDITLQLQQQQLETDRLVSQHMEKVRLLMQQRRKEQSRRVVTVIKEAILRKLKEKEEEIEKAVKLNWFLEERVNALFLESQMWRNLAESHEATANVLRNNLEEILTNHHQVVKEEAVAEDAESCCGSSNGDVKSGGSSGGSGSSVGLCRKCGKEEASVVLLPCRHLCVCVSCATNLHKCLVCDSRNSGSVHVNM